MNEPSSGSSPTSSGAQRHKRAPSAAELDPNNSKRQKADPQDDKDSILIQHPNFWYPDGNVVVRVENYLFRIHSSFLKMKSEFFVEFFEGGAGTAESDGSQEWKVEGCKVYELDGKKRHFTALLDALYSGISYPNTADAKSFSSFTLACLLRASHYRNVPSCKKWAINQLVRDYGCSIDYADHDDICGRFATRFIVLSRECDETRLLVSAFYQLLGMPKLDILYTKVYIPEDADKNYFHEEEVWEEDEFVLSQQEITTAIALLQYANRRWWEFLSKPPTVPCPEKSKCSQIMKRIWHTNVVGAQDSDSAQEPLGGIQKVIDIDWEKKGICGGCVQEYRADWKNKRIQIWEGVGNTVLGLQPEETTAVANIS
ncbi:hypothetical protein BOTBODRAFT_37386 [Botryobasidium botryosum FD-172 SS1]|uniref:BTB domain-containing protein n=1 Tax=Botryobasidium botryosum (strain FD-172 SS1) TaxID=930990 RepID=A0A067MB82_BOTB1|nr:hypothetical protein BOTBODRAFT_37386 [Botryobasidium botryosum FD-172 SS1]